MLYYKHTRSVPKVSDLSRFFGAWLILRGGILQSSPQLIEQHAHIDISTSLSSLESQLLESPLVYSSHWFQQSCRRKGVL